MERRRLQTKKQQQQEKRLPFRLTNGTTYLRRDANLRVRLGEVVAGNAFGSVYVGRGRTPDTYVDNITEAVDTSNPKHFIHEQGLSAFDGVAFHYTVYRFLSRFLGLDGTFGAEGDPSVGWIEFWETILSTNDMINANDGVTFDPRHMYGVTNQDVFRWPTIKNGIEKQLLGYFIIALLLPGIPTLLWGEEQVRLIRNYLSNISAKT